MSQIYINSSVIMGRITHDPELRYTANNTPICSFQLAVPRPTSDGGYKTNFIPCVAWREKAQFISQWFTKGMLMIVIGQLTSRTWQDESKKSHTSIEILCDDVRFGETKKKADTTHSNLHIIVSNPATGEHLPGAAFDLNSTDGDIIQQNLVTGTDGHVCISNLKTGKYILTETAAPTGYDVLPNTHVISIDPGMDHTITYLHTTYSTLPANDSAPAAGVEYIAHNDDFDDSF